MALISLTIEESEEEIVYGFPRFVYVTSNISANIYYTFDGSDPDILSNIYLDSIKIPTEKLDLTLKIFATNGIDESAIIEKNYSHKSVNNIKRFPSATNGQSSTDNSLKYPFGTNEFYSTTKFVNIGDTSSVIYNPELDGYSNGFDADGYSARFTNKEYNTANYKIVYTNKNNDGTDKGIGTLPSQVTFKQKTTPPEESQMNTALFDPRALVIYLDATKQKDTDPPIITTQFMSLENLDIDPAKKYSSGIDSPNVYGTFIRSYHNPKDNTLTSYYYDNVANKWFITKSNYTPTNKPDNLSGYVMGRGEGGRFVYTWIPFQKRFLF